MTVQGQLTPLEAAQQIGVHLGLLDEKLNAYRGAEISAAKKRAEYKAAEARAYLSAEGSIPERKARATVVTETLYEESEVADAVVRVVKEEKRAIETHIDALRTLAATLRAEFQTLHYGPG
jgi:hypothetical protein